MENIVGLIIELVKLISSRINECGKFHQGVDEEMGSLRDKWQYLEAQKTEIESRIGGKQPTKQVELWLEKVDTIKGEVQAIEGSFAKMKYFSRAHVGKLASKMITKVENHYKMELPSSLVLDSPGETLSATVLIGESTAEKVKKEIWACLFDDNDVRKIGVYGMGGIGKSTVMEHINNSLLKETNKFDHVIWVTVSKSFNVIQLQHDIARKLDLDLSKVEDVRERAAKLKAKLKEKKRFVLILDDMWEAFALEEVGIPEPTLANGCKLALTTRNHNVCVGMSCKSIKMELLSKEESRKLFLDKLGHDVFNIPNLKAIAKEVLEKCAQLPLAIVTIVASFKCLTDDFEWRDALEELRTSVKGSNNKEQQVIEKLKFSYDRLESERLKQCLLHCALHPEDFEIDKQELIEHLIDEGIIERRNNRQSEFDKGYSMLKKLENACLLEGVIHKYSLKQCVKMHDLVRDMVSQVASPQFKVEGYLGLEDFSDEGKWGEDLVKASLMYNKISRIPPNASPMCPKLSTLLLQGNGSLKVVPDSLFEHLHGLNVLDLSNTGIESLPNSISNLENLTTLRLGGCRFLKRVPLLAKLTKLRKLNLGKTEITEVPDGLEMLVNLRYLDLNARELQIMPSEILPKLSHLQYLAVFPEVKGEEVASLKNLETFGGLFSDMYEYSTYIRSLEERQLATYEIQVGKPLSSYNSLDQIWGKRVVLQNCNISKGEESFLLSKDVHDLRIYSCNNLRCLCNVPSLNDATELEIIYLKRCKGIEHILCSSSSCCTLPLQTLEILQFWGLDNLRVLFRKEKDASAQVPPHTFSRLKIISIYQCGKLEKLLPPGLLLHLHNLEHIDVADCEQLEEIIEEEEEEIEEEGMDTTKITLPRLKKLWLQDLPELKSICSSSKVISCDSLEEIFINCCPKLKRLPLSLPLLNGQLSPPPSLKQIEAKEEWWESLEWDCQDTKNVLQPFLRKFRY